MFDELRKKVSNAIKGLIKKEDNHSDAADAVTRADESSRKENGKQDIELNLSVGTKIKGAFLGEVHLSDADIEGFLSEIETAMLQADVSYSATEEILKDLKDKLSEVKFKSKTIKQDVFESVRQSFSDILDRSKSGMDVAGFIKARMAANDLPVKILFIGPNGTGKTTTMGKLAALLKKEGISSVFSASDTFRAAAIEQTEHHAKALGLPVIKSTYGADPASIAFDAIAYAKAHGFPVVLIDTAGRQETNRNLISEMLKMVKVAKPDITIFIGESTAGNALSSQIAEFSKHMKIDGIILTKLDCDAKGGNAVSISYTTGIPILFFGVGEGYESLKQYSKAFVLDSILPNS